MISKAWRFLGSIRLSFWLLVSGAVCLGIGSFYVHAHFSFFRSLSQTPIQIWLARHLSSSLSLVWWIPLLFIIMGGLGINILVCASQRTANLFRQGNTNGSLQFIHKLTPTLIHFLFPVILAGHLVTFTMARWHRIPIKEGTIVKVDNSSTPFTVQSVKNTYYPGNTPMRRRLLQTHVEMDNGSQSHINLEFLNPVALNGTHLHLDMIKKRYMDRKKEVPPPPTAEETCNKAEVYHKSPQQNAEQKLLLLMVKDPGLYPICFGLLLVLILMLWYFFYPYLRARKIKTV